MPQRKLLHESTSSTLERKGNVWEAVILTPGKGSSGTYAEDMIAANITGAFPAGTKHWFNHPTEDKPHRDPRDQWGVSVEDATHAPGVGGKTKIKILEHWRPVVEALAEEGQADLSIWVMGESDEDGNVTALFPDRQNSVDLVGYPGRPGSALTTKLLESARAASGIQPPTASVEDPNRKDHNMEKWEEAIADIRTLVTSSITESKAALTAAEARATKAEADAQAALDSVDVKVKEAVTALSQKLESIKDAKLAPKQEKALIAAAEAGEDITTKLAEAIEVFTEFKTLSEAGGGSFIRGSESAGFEFSAYGKAGK
jgi:hypothetical protein